MFFLPPSRLIVSCGIFSRCSICESISGLWAVLYYSFLFPVVLTVRGRHRCQAQLFCHHEKLCPTTRHWGLDDPWVFTARLHWCDFYIFNIYIFKYLFSYIYHLDYLSYCQHLLIFLSFQTCMTFVLPWNTKRYILKNVSTALFNTMESQYPRAIKPPKSTVKYSI